MTEKTTRQVALSNRRKWQQHSAKSGKKGEGPVLLVLRQRFALPGSPYVVEKTPDWISQSYIHDGKPRGFQPDFGITNTLTGKRVCGEAKNQAAGGSAQERVFKCITPGFLSVCRVAGGYGEHSNVNPIWCVMRGSLASPKYHFRDCVEFLAGDEWRKHFFYWEDENDPHSLLEFFDENIAPMMEGQAVQPATADEMPPPRPEGKHWL